MKGKIQFIQVSPDELNDLIIRGIRAELNSLKTEFQPKQPTEFLSRNQVKDLLSIDLGTVHNWTKAGRLKAYGIGNRVYYKRSEVEAAIQPLN